MREIAIDTETTGLDPKAGHRIVEIACVELVNHVPTGEEFHSYINPERDMPIEAYEIHGLDEAFLAKHPTFDKVADPFLEFIADVPLVIHNAEFDLRFINAELLRLDRIIVDRARAIDTLAIARRKYPGAQASLDALCRRFEIDLSDREKHGALIDTRLLAAVYLELIGGRQPGFALTADGDRGATAIAAERPRREPRPHAPSEAEVAAHEAFLEKINKPLWRA
ncbi:MAG: DNA polymerase III subunit epsilon [Alphaproteobacteria bacterium]|nr:DNA polymerase III subunit epsilon [Alphaproteobacteria bacterium]